MSASRSPGLYVLILVALGFATWLATRSGSTSGRDASGGFLKGTAVLPSTSETSWPDGSGVVLETADPRDTGREASPRPVHESKSAEERAELTREFEKKYAGKTRLELRQALASLEVERRDLQKELMESRRRAGLFTKFYPEPSQTVDLTALAMTDADRANPNPNHNFAGSVRGSEVDGKPCLEVVSVPRGSYPEFDALQDEEIWLNGQINQQP